MTSVNIIVNDRSYAIACEEGQEERVESLGRYIDKRVSDIAGAGAAHNESQLMVLTSLIITDELFELREEVKMLKAQMQNMAEAGQNIPQQECISPEEIEHVRQQMMQHSQQREAEIAYSISEIAEDIQGLAKRLTTV